MGTSRQKVNEVLGAVEEEGGLLKQEQIGSVLGEPFEYTKWVWVENEDREKKLDEAVPRWEKIIFDGGKIQIRIDAHPSIYGFKQFDEDFEDMDEDEKEWRERQKKRLEEYEGKLIYNT